LAWRAPVCRRPASGRRAGFIREGADWAGIAPTRPADPTDPADRWQTLDELVRRITAHGLQLAITVGGAPAWAEGPGRPQSVTPGTWRPDAVAFGQFAQALAERYSGAYLDPLHPGAVLPRVRYLRRLFVSRKSVPAIDPQAHRLLVREYAGEANAVAAILGRRPAWRNFAED